MNTDLDTNSNLPDNGKQEALRTIVTIARNHQLTAQDITTALTSEQANAQQHSGTLSRIFGYIGSILVFSGICIFIGMQWDHFGSIERISITLGLGFAIFLIALVVLSYSDTSVIATPLLLMAALLQPTGLFVLLDEYASGSDPLHGLLFISTVMWVQQGAVFRHKQRTTLAFTTVFFGFCFFVTAFELLEIDSDISWLTLGASLMLIAWALDHSKHHAISAFWYFVGSVAVLFAAFELLQDQPYEALFIGLTALIIYISTAARSRTLLFVGTVSMIGYISHFTYAHFSDTLGWPIVLIICGIILIAIGFVAMKINTRFIRAAA